MNDILRILKQLHRPRLLIRAAKFGLQEYSRERDLKRVMKTLSTVSPERAVGRLIEEEAHQEESRKSGDANYSAARHVDILIALMAEARLLLQPRQRI